MDFTELLKPQKCSCGKTHRCDIKYIYIEKNAIRHLDEMCKEYEKILIVADENTYAVAGEKCEACLKGKDIRRQIFSGKSLVIPNEEAISAVKNSLSDAELIIGIGSGVIQDLCKYISYFEGVPYYIVATAPSMDGYATSGAAMITGGMKVTYPTKVPDGFIGDTEILKSAPIEMIKAGYGDIVGKYSALNDWKLSAAVLGEYFCDNIYSLVHTSLLKTLPLAKKLLSRDEEALKILTEAIIVVGIALAYAENSRPASGSEHHLSHFFEITGILNNEAYLSHGADVAFSTVITAKMRECILSSQLPESQFVMEKCEYESEMKRVYGKISDSCIALHQKTGWYEEDRFSVYKQKEAEIRAILQEMPSAEKIEKILRDIELDSKEFYRLYSKEKLHDAVIYAKDLKDRFSVLWMYYDIFGKTVNFSV